MTGITGSLLFANAGSSNWYLYVVLVVTPLILIAVGVLLYLRNRKQSRAQSKSTVATTSASSKKAEPPKELGSIIITPAEEPKTAPARIVVVSKEVKEVLAVNQEPTGSAPSKEPILNKSMIAKLCQADDEVKQYYDELKSELLSYKGVKARMSWKYECFRKGRVLLAKLRIRGKTLVIYYPLNTADYEDTKYKVVDVGDAKANEDAPCSYPIKNERRLRYAKELIAVVMGREQLVQEEVVIAKHSAEFPYDTTKNLINRKLIKIVYGKGDGKGDEEVKYVAAEEVAALMTDDEAQQRIEESVRVADRTKTGIVNVDTLSKCFAAGDKVTLEQIKKRVPGFNKKITYVKVLARGVIDKPLTVEADDFSLDAVKMIVLTGGAVIRTKKR
ncbi:MAG: uL15 family ribosomal protein [Clostridiales bacterium]|nr:uL15 family ribosomal protein [Clostridiales bacterium]